MKKQLSELKQIFLFTNAICKSQAFGDVLTDLDLEDLGAKALKVIDEQVGDELSNTVKKRLEIRDKVLGELQKENTNVLYSDLDLALGQNKDYVSVFDREIALLNKEVEFDFEPIEVTLEKGKKLDFPESIQVSFKGDSLNLVPYPCFRECIKLGIIKINK